MRAFERLTAIAIPFGANNVDTDQILPARFMSQKPQDGYQDYCFREQRYNADGTLRSDSVFNQDAYKGANILLAGSNFGCGSSREGAVYALLDMGIRSVIGISFGDIFYQNAMLNGLLPIKATRAQIESLCVASTASGARKVMIDLNEQQVTSSDGSSFSFDISPFHKLCLLQGMDEIDFTLGMQAEITDYESRVPQLPGNALL